MNEENYELIRKPFQFLTRRSYHIANIYDGFYKCYNPQMDGVRDENLDFWKKIENLTLRHIFTAEYLEKSIYPNNYLDANLVVIEENRICIHQEMGMILLHILINKMKDGIEAFTTLMRKIKANYKDYIKVDDHERIFTMKVYRYDEFLVEFANIPDYRFIFHLFFKAKTELITLSWQNEAEIKIYRIDEMIKRLKDFNFENIPV